MSKDKIPTVTSIQESDILAAVDSFSAYDYGVFGRNDDIDYSSRPVMTTNSFSSLVTTGTRKGRPQTPPSSSSEDSDDSSGPKSRLKRKKKAEQRRIEAITTIMIESESETDQAAAAAVTDVPIGPNPVLESLKLIRGRANQQLTSDWDDYGDLAAPLPPTQPLQTVKKLAVRVRLNGQHKRFELLMTDTFQNVIEAIGKENDCPVAAVLLSRDDQMISTSDTPALLGMAVGEILDCFINNQYKAEQEKPVKQSGIAREKLLGLKFQTHALRSTVILVVDKTSTFQTIRESYVAKVGGPAEATKMRFNFDGEEVEWDSTPQEMDMDDGDCIDVVVT